MLKLPLVLCLLSACSLLAQAPKPNQANLPLTPDPTTDFFLRGKNLYDSAQTATDPANKNEYYQRAAQIFNEYITSYPTHPNTEMAWWYLGNSYYQSGQTDEGKRCFLSLINRYQNSKWAAAAAYTLAADHYNRGEYASAAPLFERYAAMAIKPDEQPRGYYFAANCYRMLNRDREASALYQKIIQHPASNLFLPQAQIALGLITAKNNQHQSALSLFETAANSPSANPKIRSEAFLHASFSATQLNQPDLADKYLKLIMKTDGMEAARPEAQLAIMSNLFDKEAYQKVIEIFLSNNLKATSEKETARLMIAAKSYMRLNKPDSALGLFREIERSAKPNSDTAFQAAYYRLLCFFQIDSQNITEQVDAFLKLYQKNNSDDSRIHTALMMKAEGLFNQKQLDQAALVYKTIDASKLNEKNRTNLIYQRGWCLAEAGDHQSAIHSFAEFIQKFPSDSRLPSALAKRASCYIQSSDNPKALADLDRLTTLNATEEITSFAWLESARLSRKDNQIPEMIKRYKGLIQNIPSINPNLQAEANYWIGWGLVKTQAATEASPYLEKARSLRPDAYLKHAGALLSLSYFSNQNASKLREEIQLAIDKNYIAEIPDQIIQWNGIQAYNSGDYATATTCLSLLANPDDPRSTPKEVWRYLAKSRLKTKDYAAALIASNHLLSVEDQAAWKADALLDQGRALLALKRYDDAKIAVEQGLELHPQGRTSGGLRILMGDLEMHTNNPQKAAGTYLIVVGFLDDNEMKPLALSKLIKALESQKDTQEALKYRQQLLSEFPNWKAPATEY